MTPAEFAAKWSGSTRSEKAAAQEHFIDLCRMLGVPTPNEADPSGEWYAFEKGASKATGGEGYADVWKRGHFAWEYKGKKRDLVAAYRQLNDYREALENPPLLVVSDLDRFEIHTNFTGTPARVYRFALADLASEPTEPLRLLRAVFAEPEALRPDITRAELTEAAARHFAELALRLRSRGHDPQAVAHFLDKLLFSLFAEDVGLLPAGLIGRLSETTRTDPAAFAQGLADLFAKMSVGGGLFGVERIQWFNGGLFDGAEVLLLETAEIDVVRTVARLDWAEIEPAIFGTLFERGLDPDRRTQLGAHYTDRAAIERLVEPVLMEPLRRDFEATRAKVEELIAARKRTTARTKADQYPRRVFAGFLQRLRAVRVLDPACGSGNFLYVALHKLKDLEREAILWGSLTLKIPQEFPQVGPEAVRGIDINLYAAELARVTIWIGEIQWMLRYGFSYRTNPILSPLDTIQTMDALLDWSDPDHVQEAVWPNADVVIGNPPFLGGKLLRASLGDEYVDTLFRAYKGRVPREADFVGYWHEKARAMVAEGQAKRVGLLATQGIRGGANRRILEHIKETGDIFLAWSDEPWVLDGAAVHISFLGYDDGTEKSRMLNGKPVASINSNLTAGIDLTRARRLRENLGVAFMGDTKGGAFDIPGDLALDMLSRPNPHGRSNREVLEPWVNGLDVTGRPRRMWIIDFGERMAREEAALYEAPFEYVLSHVKPQRDASRSTIKEWWLHERPRIDMRRALARLTRFIVTPRVSKYRVFAWMPAGTLPDSATIAIARDDNDTFGVLHSRSHELWARAMGTQLREVESGFRYTPTTTFETFPFPERTSEQREAIAEAARVLNEHREAWLNPPGASGKELVERTLTNLYNERPSWLSDDHDRLDRAVVAAYGWPSDIGDEALLARLLELNLAREAV